MLIRLLFVVNQQTVSKVLVITGIIFITCIMVLGYSFAFGQGQQNITSPPAPNAQTLSQVVDEVPAIVDQVDANSSLTSLIGTVVTGLSTYAGAKFLKDKKDKNQIEEYASSTDKIIFNHVMDNYNDWTYYCKVRRKYLNLLAEPGNEGKTEYQLLNTVADLVTKKTYMQIEAEFLDDIITWNVEYYGSPSNDPTITCPNPKNKIARTMTDIKKFSVPNTTPVSQEETL